MRRETWIIGLAAMAGLLLFAAGWWLRPGGVSPRDAAELARKAGDSAVASYRKHVDQVVPELRDSIRFYRARAEAGARLLIRRVPVAVHDTAWLPAPVPDSAGHVPDTALVVMPPLVDQGVRVAETLQVAPRPYWIDRRLSLTFQPDTLLAAILRTPEGLLRFTAAGTRAGLTVTVVDAAARPPGQRTLAGQVLSLATLGSCVGAGWQLGRGEAGTVLAGLGAGCVVGAVRELTRGRH